MNKNSLKIAFLLVVTVFGYSCSDEEVSTQLPEVKIGNQIWSSKNLAVTKFSNGDAIPEVKDVSAWAEASRNGTPAWCYIENNTSLGKQYGKLYNGYAVSDSRGLCPSGWHVPSESEWMELIDFVVYELAGVKLKSTTGWSDDGNGSNASGFTGLPGGRRDDNGIFGSTGTEGYWWSSNDGRLYYLSSDFNILNGYGYDKGYGLSVRCVKD